MVAFSRRFPTPVKLATAACAAVAFVGVGAAGAYRYVHNYWLYRGFPPPRDPAFVTSAGHVERFYVRSAALGGRNQPVDVYLPPGYDSSPTRRYPVLYLLHGFPGRPGAFFQTVRMGIVEDVLLAKHRVRPMILVAPFGSTGTFTDKEWANGIRPHEEWEAFVARDLVRAVDAHFRTIASGQARVLGGLSEGGYAALNIGLHHPGEFRVLESWSGYERADDLTAIFGHRRDLLDWNSPQLQVGPVAPALRAYHTFIWFYSSTDDRLLGQNRKFADQLTELGLPHRFLVLHGGHTWAIWRGYASISLLAASRHLGHE